MHAYTEVNTEGLTRGRRRARGKASTCVHTHYPSILAQALGMRVIVSDLPSTQPGKRDDGIEVVSLRCASTLVGLFS